MKKIFSSSFFWPCIAALFALAMVNVPFVIHNGLVNTGPSWQGLDVSWRMALNYAAQRHWVWGSDILYTYGPLAFFSTRNGWGISRWLFLLFDAFILVNFYFVFLDFLKNNKSKLLAVAILLCIVLVVNQSFNPDLS